MEFIIAPGARGDIATILVWTPVKFGPQTFNRYAKLISTAIEQIAESPNRPGILHRPEIAGIAEPIILPLAWTRRGHPLKGFVTQGIFFFFGF